MLLQRKLFICLQSQDIIIEYIIENEKLFPKDFEKLCAKMSQMDKKVKSKITKRTLQRDLRDLIDKKIIKAKGATNQQYYCLREGI